MCYETKHTCELFRNGGKMAQVERVAGSKKSMKALFVQELKCLEMEEKNGSSREGCGQQEEHEGTLFEGSRYYNRKRQ